MTVTRERSTLPSVVTSIAARVAVGDANSVALDDVPRSDLAAMMNHARLPSSGLAVLPSHMNLGQVEQPDRCVQLQCGTDMRQSR